MFGIWSCIRIKGKLLFFLLTVRRRFLCYSSSSVVLVVSYVTFVWPLFVLHLVFFWYSEKAVSRDCGIFQVS